MVDLLESIAECINKSDIGVNARLAYNREFIERPVLKSAVYITLKELRGGTVDFVAYVYSPVSENGNGCLRTARAVCDVLTSETEKFLVSSLSMSALDFNAESVAFTAKINGTVSGAISDISSIGGHIVRAFNFTKDPDLSVDVFAENISIVCDYSPYAIMTFCSGKAIDIAEGDISYKITIRGVLPSLVNTLSSKGVFHLAVTKGNTYEVYRDCICKQSEINTDYESDQSYITLVSYEKRTKILGGGNVQ